MNAVASTLAEQINNLLPQTQCTKCGYPACRAYAQAIADSTASYNQCPPGGQEGINKLADLLGQASIPLNPNNGVEKPRTLAFIDEAVCIGCTLCIQACPVDAIMGANKQMHTVIPELCTGCDLCVAPCPVDCIAMIPSSDSLNKTGWQAWSQEQADSAKLRYQQRELRLIREKQENEKRLLAKAHEKLKLVSSETAETQSELDEKERKKKIIANAILRATNKKEQQQ
ncbi:electron transport complex subunit RsxB [Undibacterium amnicola]|uniref:Electron transport complex subunit RsxB n=1 Tax=Undibacterium amnicola TaxID=1834038 RepID=A0ABR6XLP0_9BURK|nr:electron transport complex subunit RsxB [Undibacterium amnicola]